MIILYSRLWPPRDFYFIIIWLDHAEIFGYVLINLFHLDVKCKKNQITLKFDNSRNSCSIAYSSTLKSQIILVHIIVYSMPRSLTDHHIFSKCTGLVTRTNLINMEVSKPKASSKVATRATGSASPRKGPPKFKQRSTRQFKSKPPKKGVIG